VRHLAHKRAAFWTLIYGVYAAGCACAKYFTAVIEGVGLKCGYTDGVRQKIVDLLVRDHLSVYKVQARSQGGVPPRDLHRLHLRLLPVGLRED